MVCWILRFGTPDKVVEKCRKKIIRVLYFHDVIKKFLAHRLAMLGAIILLIEILCVVFLPVFMELIDPYSMDYAAFRIVPSAEHIIGM